MKLHNNLAKISCFSKILLTLLNSLVKGHRLQQNEEVYFPSCTFRDFKACNGDISPIPFSPFYDKHYAVLPSPQKITHGFKLLYKSLHDSLIGRVQPLRKIHPTSFNKILLCRVCPFMLGFFHYEPGGAPKLLLTYCYKVSRTIKIRRD